MCPVWRPVSAPPQLERFCHLSADAQTVMAGIYRQYNEQRKQLAAKTQQQKGTYYQEMYERRFWAPPCVDTSSPQTMNTRVLPGHVQSSSSLEMNDLDLDAFSEKLEVMCRNPNSDSVTENQYESFSKNSQSSSTLSRNLSLKDTDKDQICTFPNITFPNSDKEMPIQKEQICTFPNTTFPNSDREMPILKEQICTFPNITLEDSNTDMAIQQNLHVHDNERTNWATPLNKKIDSNPEKESVVHEDLSDVTLENHFLKSTASTLTIKGTQKENSREKNIIIPKRTSSISARLKQHMTIRKDLQMKQNQKDCSKRVISSPKRPTMISFADSNKESSHFSIPYKKQKQDVTEREVPIVKTHEPQGMLPFSKQHTACDVATLRDQDLREVLQTLLSSSEVLICLVYKNGSTQLRDTTTAPNKRKSAGNSRQKQRTSEVQAVAVCGCKGSTGLSQEDKVWLFPVPDQNHTEHTQIKEFWKELLLNQHRKICCDAKMLLVVLMRGFGIKDFKGVTVFDPIVAAWLMDPDCENVTFQKSLSLVCLILKDNVLSSAVELLKEDLCLLSELMRRLYQKLISRDQWDLYCCVEMKLLPLLAAMELRPLRIDVDTMLRFSNILKRKLQKLEKNAHEAAGHPFLINSPAQLRQVLFEELKLDKKLPGNRRLAKTNIGHQISTSEAVLNQLVDTHHLPGIILEYRQVQKLKSTYVDGMMSCVQDGYISTHWDQTSAATGRLSSYQPNIQAIPKTSTVISDFTDNFIIGKKRGDTVEIFARDSFISHDGWSFLSADFQQIELRLLAHLADDPTLLKIFTNAESGSKDIFIELTTQWLCKPVSLVTTQEREQTKRVVYSVMYGAGKDRLAEYLKMSSSDAKAIIDSFLVKFPAVNQFSKKCVEFCQKNGFTTTIFKRRRLIPNIKSPSPVLRAQAERQAVNFCVQGSAADLCKAAMIQVEHTLQSHAHLKARLVVQIHDELLLEVLDEDLNAIRSLVQTVMEDEAALCGNMVSLKVPIKVSLSAGKTWGHLSPLDSGKML
ncbi:DNA polymerase nu-like [Argopecten irradians]|uniref:DNA polymerase nu-like n=1 Tax=Argopecten irradians TaxID=31199 RepID=UPI003722C8F7